MATASEVKNGLDRVAAAIRAARAAIVEAKVTIDAQIEALNGLATNYADVVATVQAYTGADAFEDVAKAELARLTTEFGALLTAAQAASAAIE